MQTNHIWRLLTKKLKNEATVPELEELNRALDEDPVLAFTANQLEQCWGPPTKDLPGSPAPASKPAGIDPTKESSTGYGRV